MPNSYTDNEFTSCEGDLQDVVGTYTSNGQSKCSWRIVLLILFRIKNHTNA